MKDTIDTIHAPDAPELSFRMLVAALLLSVARLIILARHRHASRKALSWLNDDQLRDIGLSRERAREEWQKPFWR